MWRKSSVYFMPDSVHRDESNIGRDHQKLRVFGAEVQVAGDLVYFSSKELKTLPWFRGESVPSKI